MFSTGKATRRSSGPVAAKHANPANPSQIWSGRGKRLFWFNEAPAKGTPEARLLTDGAPRVKTAALKKAAAKKGALSKTMKKATRKATKK